MSEHRITADELAHAAKLQDYVDRQLAKWGAADARKGRPPTERELTDRWVWQALIEERAWEDFFSIAGRPLDAGETW